MAIANRTKALGAAGAGMLAIAAAFITPLEGTKPVPYRDIVGVWTVCTGSTTAEMRVHTPAECRQLLEKELAEYDAGMRGCLRVELPVRVHVAFLSATYNIGVKGFCSSSMARRANAGDLKGACDALLLWNKAGGQVINGLDRRRHLEHELCVRDVQ